MLPKATRTNTVSASLALRFGDEKSLLGDNAVAELTSSMLMRGTKTKTRQQLQEEMDKLDVRIGVGGGGRGGGGRGAALGSVDVSIQQAPAANLIPALRLAAEIFERAGFS